MNPIRRGDRVQVHIDRLSVGGRGVGRRDGLVIFVPDVAPGEDVEVDITFLRKNFAEGSLVRVVHASSHRITPLCSVAGVCGGCNWQHVAYDEQLRQKRSLVAESLRRFANFQSAEMIDEVVPSPTQYRYRNRIQLHFADSQMGFHRRGSHSIVDIRDCPITEQAICDTFPQIREQKIARGRDKGRIELYVDQNGSVRERTDSTVPTTDDLTELGAVDQPFEQVNTLQNRNLVDFVIGLAKRCLTPLPDRAVLFDLYAGSGNFTFPLCRAFPRARVRAVELNSTSTRTGTERAAQEFAGSDLTFTASDVHSFLAQTAERPTLIVLDPPRAGTGADVIGRICDLDPQFIIYISCHPVTLARDLKDALARGYTPSVIRPFDMFPQTDHVETVVLLMK